MNSHQLLLATLLIAACCAPALPQDDDLQSVVARLARNAERIEALEWHPRTWYGGRDYYDRGNTARGRFVRGHGLRFEVTVVNCSEPQEHRPEEGPNRFALLWTPKDVSLALALAACENLPGRGPPLMLLRAAQGDPALKALDPLFVHPLLPVLFVMNSPILAATLDPRMILSFEPGLRLAGRDTFDQRACWKLESARALGDLEPSVPVSWCRVADQTKRFYVDVESGDLLSIVYEQTLRRPEGAVKVTLTSRVLARNADRLPQRLETVVQEEGLAPVAFRQVIDYLPTRPDPADLTGWDVEPAAAAGPITLADAPPPAHLQRFQRRMHKLVVQRRFDTAEEATEFQESVDALAADAADGGRGLMTKHWLVRSRLGGDASDLTRKAVALKSLSPAALAYFAEASLLENRPADTRDLLDRAPQARDPFVRLQATLLRMRALQALDRAADIRDTLAAAVATCPSLEDKLHVLWHLEELSLRQPAMAAALRPHIAALAKDRPDEAAYAIASALDHGHAGRPDDERRTLESLLDRAPDDPWIRHLYLRAAWRQLATVQPPRLGIRLNRKLGPYGHPKRFEPSTDEAVRARARAFAERLRPWAEAAKDDPRPAFLVALAAVRGGDGDVQTWVDRALATEPPDEAIACNAASRVFAEIALLADRRDDLETLARAARRWEETGVRSGWPDAEFLRDHDRSPLRRLLIRLIERRDLRRLFRTLAFADPVHASGALSLQDKFAALDLDACLAAAIEELGPGAAESDYRKGADFFLRHFAHTDKTTHAALRLLETMSKPTVTILMDRAKLAVRLREWDRVAENAVAALAQHEHHEGLALYAARVHALRGKPEEGRRLLAAFAARHPVTRPYHFGLACEQLGDYDGALDWFEKAERAGLKAHFRLGRLYEGKERWDDAMRCYNRSIAGERALPGWPEPEVLPEPLVRSDWPADPSEGRARILAKLGENHYVDRLLQQKVDLSSDEERRLDAMIRTLTDASAAAPERRKAVADLRAFGPRAAKTVHPVLKSTDLYAAAVARELVNAWAEPR